MHRRLIGGLISVLLALPLAAHAQSGVAVWAYTAQDQVGHVLRKKVGTGAYVEVARVPKGTMTFTDPALTVGQSTCYTATPYNATGEGAPSNEVCVTPVSIPTGATTLTITVQ